MHRVPAYPLHHWSIPDVHSVFHNGPPRGLFLLGALLFALLGIALALQAVYLRRGSIRRLLGALLRGTLQVVWLVPILGVLVFFGLHHSVRRVQGPPVFTMSEAIPVSSSWNRDLVFRDYEPLLTEAPDKAAIAGSDALSEPNVSPPAEPAAPFEPLAPDLPTPPESVRPILRPMGPPGPQSQPTAKTPDELTKRPTNTIAASPNAGHTPLAQPQGPTKPETSLPDWIKSEAGYAGQDRRLVVVKSELSATPQQAEADALNRAVERVALDFSTAHLDARGWRPPATFVRGQAVRRVHVQRIDRKTLSSGIPFHVYRAYCQVELSAAVRNACFPIWREQTVGRRMAALGGLFGLLTLTFGTLATYFRLDDRTSGQYRRRLKLAAVSVITAGGFAAGLLL